MDNYFCFFSFHGQDLLRGHVALFFWIQLTGSAYAAAGAGLREHDFEPSVPAVGPGECTICVCMISTVCQFFPIALWFLKCTISISMPFLLCAETPTCTVQIVFC